MVWEGDRGGAGGGGGATARARPPAGVDIFCLIIISLARAGACGSAHRMKCGVVPITPCHAGGGPMGCHTNSAPLPRIPALPISPRSGPGRSSTLAAVPSGCTRQLGRALEHSRHGDRRSRRGEPQHRCPSTGACFCGPARCAARALLPLGQPWGREPAPGPRAPRACIVAATMCACCRCPSVALAAAAAAAACCLPPSHQRSAAPPPNSNLAPACRRRSRTRSTPSTQTRMAP